MDTRSPSILTETLQTPIEESCDVLVVGGGTAGVIAALAAARNGARTVLVEQNAFLGGSMLGGGVIWMGFYNTYKPYGLEPIQLIRGIPELLRQRLVENHGSTGFYEELADPVHESLGLHADRDVLPAVLLEMAREYGVEVRLKTTMADTIVDGDTIRGIVVESKSGRSAILAKVVIDTTGDADVAYRAGTECVRIPGRQSGGMAFGLANVDFEKMLAFIEQRGVAAYLGYADKGGEHRDRITRIGFKLSKLEEFQPYQEEFHLHQEPCIVSNRENHATMVNGVTMNFDTTDAAAMTEAQATLTRCCFKMAELFKAHLPGCENSYLDWLSPTVGVRFGRQVVCEYDIRKEDIDGSVVPADAIGLYGLSDAHYKGYDIKGGWYGIPYRALVPKKTENLLVAGRMISSDWLVWMSTRMIGSCFLQGQAAGTAAAMSARTGVRVRDIDTDALRANLLRDGAWLG